MSKLVGRRLMLTEGSRSLYWLKSQLAALVEKPNPQCRLVALVFSDCFRLSIRRNTGSRNADEGLAAASGREH